MNGRFKEDELGKMAPYLMAGLGLDTSAYLSKLQEAKDPDLQNTGKEGLGGSSQLGIYPRGDFVATVSQEWVDTISSPPFRTEKSLKLVSNFFSKTSLAQKESVSNPGS